MEIPPTMPNRPLNVRSAICSPFGTEMITMALRVPITDRTASVIIVRGTGLMAGSPTGTRKPFFVTIPTPSPA